MFDDDRHTFQPKLCTAPNPQVWDLEAGTLYYQSAILCAAALTYVAMDPLYNRVAVGAADGVVRFFDLSTAACSQLQVYPNPNPLHNTWPDPFAHAPPP